MVTHRHLTGIAFGLNHLIDSGKDKGVTVQMVHEWSAARWPLQSLKEHLGEGFDISLLDDESLAWCEQQISQLVEADIGDRLYGEHRGVCLILGCIIEVIQEGSGWIPRQ